MRSHDYWKNWLQEDEDIERQTDRALNGLIMLGAGMLLFSVFYWGMAAAYIHRGDIFNWAQDLVHFFGMN